MFYNYCIFLKQNNNEDKFKINVTILNSVRMKNSSNGCKAVSKVLRHTDLINVQDLFPCEK